MQVAMAAPIPAPELAAAKGSSSSPSQPRRPAATPSLSPHTLLVLIVAAGFLLALSDPELLRILEAHVSSVAASVHGLLQMAGVVEHGSGGGSGGSWSPRGFRYRYGIAISSCERYFDAVPWLLDDLAARKPPYVDILVAVGGSSSPGVITHLASGATVVNVSYLGFDVLALQWIGENAFHFNETPYWFLFHDTMRFHEGFFDSLDKIADRCGDPSVGKALGLSLSYDQPMNMGLYTVKQLMGIQHVLDGAMEYSGDLREGKKKAVMMEGTGDVRLNPYPNGNGLLPPEFFLSRRHFQCLIERDGEVLLLPDWHGANIVLHHFPDVDITKVQQNYGVLPGGPTFNAIHWSALLPFIDGWRDSLHEEYARAGALEPPHLMCPAYNETLTALEGGDVDRGGRSAGEDDSMEMG
jgi:hypothetical protein